MALGVALLGGIQAQKDARRAPIARHTNIPSQAFGIIENIVLLFKAAGPWCLDKVVLAHGGGGRPAVEKGDAICSFIVETLHRKFFLESLKTSFCPFLAYAQSRRARTLPPAPRPLRNQRKKHRK